jgi:hypothetical protein
VKCERNGEGVKGTRKKVPSEIMETEYEGDEESDNMSQGRKDRP